MDEFLNENIILELICKFILRNVVWDTLGDENKIKKGYKAVLQ